MARLAGKVAFITGGGGGIGRATAERFAEEGAKVVIAEIDTKRGKAAAESARARANNSGGNGLFIHTDVRERKSVEAALAQTMERFGSLTILHNNAGGSTPQDGMSPRRRTKNSGAQCGSMFTAHSSAPSSAFR